MSWYSTWYGESGGGGGGGGSAEVLSLQPTSFAGLDPDTARWTPIQALIQVRTGDNFWILCFFNGSWVIAYDADNGWNPYFQGQSSVTTTGNPDQFQVVVMPNGGWQSEDFQLKFLSGTDMTEP
jgi:hypothetical protein